MAPGACSLGLHLEAQDLLQLQEEVAQDRQSLLPTVSSKFGEYRLQENERNVPHDTLQALILTLSAGSRNPRPRSGQQQDGQRSLGVLHQHVQHPPRSHSRADGAHGTASQQAAGDGAHGTASQQAAVAPF